MAQRYKGRALGVLAETEDVVECFVAASTRNVHDGSWKLENKSCVDRISCSSTRADTYQCGGSKESQRQRVPRQLRILIGHWTRKSSSNDLITYILEHSKYRRFPQHPGSRFDALRIQT